VKEAIYFDQHTETSSSITIYSDHTLIEFTIPECTKYSIEKLVYPGLEIAMGEELTLYYIPDYPSYATLGSFWDQYLLSIN
jgi:hypothetical protein